MSVNHTRTIMIVDDHPHIATTLAHILEKIDGPLEILTANSAEEALAISAGKELDVIITDFMMPGMNGLELLEELKKQEREPAHSILITGHEIPGLQTYARIIKVGDILIKPIKSETIREIVNKALRKRQVAPADAKTTAVKSKILIADDRPDNVRLLTVRLKSEGYDFISAYDGNEVLEKMRAEKPDLVLLDVDMPKKNGFEVLEEARSDPGISHIPVIVLTAARIGVHDVREGLGLGADDYVTKPFDWRELSARIRAKLRVKQAEDVLRRRNKQLEMLPQIGQDLSARLDLEELSKVVLERSISALNANNAHLAIFNSDGSVFHRLHKQRDFGPEKWQDIQERLVVEGLVAHVAAAGDGAIIKDTTQDPRWLKLPNDPVRAAIAVPLLGRRGVLGVLTLNHDQTGYFSEEHLALLQAISSQASIAVENAQLYEMEHKRVTELSALNKLTRALNEFTRISDVFEQIPGLIKDTMGYSLVSMWLTKGDELVMYRVAGAPDELSDALWVLGPQQAANTGQPAMFSTAMDLDDTDGVDKPVSVSTIAVPLIRSGAPEGVLAVHSQFSNVFSESDRVVLETIAAQIGTALERIRLFEAVEKEERRLKVVLEAAADAILLVDSLGRVQLVNPAGEKLFTDVDTRIGQQLPKGGGYDPLIDLIQEASRTQELAEAELPWPDQRTFAGSVTPVENGLQVAVLHDVTHFKDLERVKNEFIATASHDLKNPINAVMGFSDLLGKAGELNPMQADFASRIGKASRQMYELVVNMLDLARVDLNVELDRSPCSMRDLIQSTVHEFEIQAESKNQTIDLPDFGDRHPIVLGDIGRLRQILHNLIGNAIKYTPDGGKVMIDFALEDGSIWTHVRDTGIGIPAQDLPYLFDKFYRVRTVETEEIEGNGLGLAIVKALVEQHGGEITVESAYKKGTCFSFRLPLASVEVQPHHA